MYSDATKIYKTTVLQPEITSSLFVEDNIPSEREVMKLNVNHHEIMNDTLMACKELGFREEKVIPIAQKILGANLITKPEQLIHLVLKEL